MAYAYEVCDKRRSLWQIFKLFLRMNMPMQPYWYIHPRLKAVKNISISKIQAMLYTVSQYQLFRFDLIFKIDLLGDH